MAAVATKLSTAMVIKVVTGQNAQGQDIISSKKFANVKSAATEQSIYDVAAAMDAVLESPMNELNQVVTYGIANA